MLGATEWFQHTSRAYYAWGRASSAHVAQLAGDGYTRFPDYREIPLQESTAMKFGAHYLPTYIPELDGPAPEFYRKMFEQMELLDHLEFHQVWVTEHHFHEYGGTIPDPATFLSAVARRTTQIRPRLAIVGFPPPN